MKDTLETLWELLKNIPAAIWTTITTAFVTWFIMRKKQAVDIDEKILQNRLKEKKFDLDRYDSLLDELMELEKRLDDREELMKQRDELIKKQSEELLSARELIKELRAELNLLRTIKDTEI